LPIYAIRDEVQSGQFKVLTVQNVDLTRATHIVWQRERALSSVQLNFVSLLVDAFPHLASLTTKTNDAV